MVSPKSDGDFKTAEENQHVGFFIPAVVVRLDSDW